MQMQIQTVNVKLMHVCVGFCISKESDVTEPNLK